MKNRSKGRGPAATLTTALAAVVLAGCGQLGGKTTGPGQRIQRDNGLADPQPVKSCPAGTLSCDLEVSFGMPPRSGDADCAIRVNFPVALVSDRAN